MSLKFKFSDSQLHQLEPINAVAELLSGIQQQDSSFQMVGESEVIPNLPSYEMLDFELIRENLIQVQSRTHAPTDVTEDDHFVCTQPVNINSELQLDPDRNNQKDTPQDLLGNTPSETPHFTIEMETGTGKTYVYLRTIFELHQKFGFRKFVIVVPSVAILEGVKKAYEITHTHFTTLYGNFPRAFIEYDGGDVSGPVAFGCNTFLSILLITRDSFNKTTNNLYKVTDTNGGKRPFEFIAETRPVVILDEPQNLSSDKSQQALRCLNPLFVLRYSATHKQTPNQIFKLTPLDAFRLGLVKQIEVVGVSDLNLHQTAFLKLEGVLQDGNSLRAQVKASVLNKGLIEEKTFFLKPEDDLFKLTNLEEHRGKVVSNIIKGQGKKPSFVEFTNGEVLGDQQSIINQRMVFQAQIEETIQIHIEKQKALEKYGIKVLSLFFIDKVDNYVGSNAMVKQLFDDAFLKYRHLLPQFQNKEPHQVREGYFAKRKDKKGETYLDEIKASDKADQAAERAAFKLIMQEKEKLLSFEEPTAFIFAHSALKEGWDNPNVFQICTLRNAQSDSRRRQEIGRGLRLCVNQQGDRVEGFNINVLTVIANDTYENFVRELQANYQEDGYQMSAETTPKERKKATAQRNDAIFKSDEFTRFWEHVSRRLQYEVKIKPETLIQEALGKLSRSFPEPRMVVQKAKIVMREHLIHILSVDPEKNTVSLRIRYRDTDGSSTARAFPHDYTQDWKVGDSLKGVSEGLNYKINSIDKKDGEHRVVLSNGQVITESQPLNLPTQLKQAIQVTAVTSTLSAQEIPDVISRVADATQLTKKTIWEIFSQLPDSDRAKLPLSPETWINHFIKELKNVLLDHVAKHIEFTSQYQDSLGLEECFPPTSNFAQHEVIPGNAKSLYDQIQVDSQVEKDFISLHIEPDLENIVFFFKFPSRFKIGLPKIIGNYNPDWGVVRRTAEGLKLQLIRETKGTDDIADLQYAHERRKCLIAKQYFAKLNIDYRIIAPKKSTDYWKKDYANQALI